jgi:hypothetical protein
MIAPAAVDCKRLLADAGRRDCFRQLKSRSPNEAVAADVINEAAGFLSLIRFS